MRLLTINNRVSRTYNLSSLYLTVNFILLLREFNHSVNFSRDGTLSNQILKQSSRNLDQWGGNKTSSGLLLTSRILLSIVVIAKSA